ncbi:hypothetical protein [Desulforhabdus amnigena]|jgi:hypothetical protein|uniref:Uncharacterized protein n=1 Tax=Desulforhabdus amnigena TaxID=40218 RepID=A0A9W6D4G7_9BACT|nr:hypothetical protein [Desulforhabdus amnigena]NLJ29913.1 hypothetical protein [Deltaproteobacteria bacterium]GLI33970.1 hypothetical protein DAMNIGENAA_14030 [Desulforhabdus amnigena]
MAEQLRSATALVNSVLSNPATIEELKVDPEGILRKFEAQVTQQLPPPSSKIIDAIWLIIVIAFAFSLIYSVWVLGAGVSTELKKDVVYATKSDTMLTIVTTVVGFLAGLLAPSPVGKKNA